MIENIPDAPEIQQAMRTGENGYSYSPEPPALCSDCGEPIWDWAFEFEGCTICRDCCRERLIDYMDTNFQEAARALGCTATYMG